MVSGLKPFIIDLHNFSKRNINTPMTTTLINILFLDQVNPPSLLSTIELVNALGGSALQGEALYWWTQFCAAVAYIKTMDYPRPDNNDT